MVHGESRWDSFAGSEQSGWIFEYNFIFFALNGSQWHILYTHLQYIVYIYIICIIMCVLRYTLKSETHGLHFAWYQSARLSMLGDCPCTVLPRLSCVAFHQGSSRKWVVLTIPHLIGGFQTWVYHGLPWFTSLPHDSHDLPSGKLT